jgi:cytochrome c oxidase cbb3-type subunit 3
MTELPTGFWAGWVVILTVVSFGFLCWFIFSIYFSKRDVQHNDLVWDGNLREGANPAPMWWFWFILCALIFSVIYLMLYPGLGSYGGLLNWNSGVQVMRDDAAYEREFGERRKSIVDAEFADIYQDEKAMASAQSVYNRNCAVCHGYEAQGQANLFPNLADDDWQWGGAAAQIEQSIRNGRNAVMVAWQPVLGDQGVSDVTDYVIGLSKGGSDDHPGMTQYTQFCSACHAPDGSGNSALGAPNLRDSVWLYGGDPDAVTESIAHGRSGVMPAFGKRLDDAQIKLLVAWLTAPD